MGITTYVGRVRRALLNKGESVYWVGIGRSTAWPNEDVPPDPAPAATDIEEALVFAKAGQVSLCKAVDELSGPGVTIEGQDYEFVADVDAYTEAARWLYLETTFDPALGMPTGSFRQTGVFANLTPAGGYETEDWLTPDHVDDRGTLEYLAHHTVRQIQEGDQRVIGIVIEFR